MRIAFALCLAVLVSPVARAQDFPLTIPTKFGDAVLGAKPERIASLDFAGADDLLALGVQPVVIRYWYGDAERVLWPWAAPLLDEMPTVLRGQIDYEAIAAAEPDVILALWSGINADDHAKLSQIAPVVAVPDGVSDYALPWDERARIAGRATGYEAEAEALVTRIEDRLAAIAAANPDWQGRGAVTAYYWRGTPGAYTSQDVRAQLLKQMGFVTPPAVDAAALPGNPFAAAFSPEDLSPLDTDLLIWLTDNGSYDDVLDLAARPFLQVHREGREVFTDLELGSALSHASLLSLPYAIDRLVPMIEAALDGDLNTHADNRPAE